MIADGYNNTHSYATTGVNGTPMAAVAAGQVLDVLVMNNNATATSCTVTDQLGNAYNLIQHVDYTTYGFEFYRYASVITNAGVPAITGQLGLIPASVSIAALVVPGVDPTNPFTAGQTAAGQNTPTNAPNGMSSGNVPPAALVPCLLTAWGYSSSDNTAPVAGSRFQSLGFAWGDRGGQCLTYEIETLANSVPTPATFTMSVANRAFTLAAILNLPSSPVPGSGPIPRCIYVMP